MTDAPQTPPPPHRPAPALTRSLPPWVGIALIVSLCLNLIALGAFSVMTWRMSASPAASELYDRGNEASETPRGPGYGPGAGRGMGYGRGFGHGMGRGGMGQGMGLGHGPLNPHMLTDAVPGRADDIRKILERRRDRLVALRHAALAARASAADMLRDRHYTKTGFEDALTAVRKADNALEAEVLDTVAECVNGLTPEERMQAAERSLRDRKPRSDTHGPQDGAPQPKDN